MIYIVAIFFVAVSTFLGVDCSVPSDQLIPLDEIKVVLISGENTEIITKSDIERPGITGEIRELDDLILELIIYLDAQKHKIVPDDQAIDEYLASLQRESNLTQAQLTEIFASAGYTFAEGRGLLRRIQAVNTMIDFKVRSNLIVPRKDVEAYYDEHPEYIEERYAIVRAELPILKNVKKEREKVEVAIKEKKSFDKMVTWSEPFWIKKSSIAEEKKGITKLEANEVLLAGQEDGFFELFKLVGKEDRRLRTLEERYHDIAKLLQKPRFEELLKKYKESLFESITIIRP